MTIQKNFIRFTSVCCFITVVTTLGIHAWFPDPPASFEERILLFRSSIYLFNRWWVIAHCLLVITAMWGFAILQLKKPRVGQVWAFYFFVCLVLPRSRDK